MAKYYSNLLKKNPQRHHDLICFDPHVVDRYRKKEGPWALSLGPPDSVAFWGWSGGEPILLVVVYCSMGEGPAAGKRMAYLTDLDAMPKSEQEHWHRYEWP